MILIAFEKVNIAIIEEICAKNLCHLSLAVAFHLNQFVSASITSFVEGTKSHQTLFGFNARIFVLGLLHRN